MPRTVENIRAENQKQLAEAFGKGRVTEIKKMQSASGVKDTVLNLWIEKVLLQARAIRNADPKISATAMEGKLRTWLNEQPGDKENPLLSVPGAVSVFPLSL
jgi:hypothetical protein